MHLLSPLHHFFFEFIFYWRELLEGLLHWHVPTNRTPMSASRVSNLYHALCSLGDAPMAGQRQPPALTTHPWVGSHQLAQWEDLRNGGASCSGRVLGGEGRRRRDAYRCMGLCLAARREGRMGQASSGDGDCYMSPSMCPWESDVVSSFIF
jgi:hypothetical protein